MKSKRHYYLGLVVALLVATVFCHGCASKNRLKKWTGKGARHTSSGGLKSARPYTIMGVTYYPIEDAYGFTEKGLASWYGPKFHGKPTASGETYDMWAMTAAHKTLPLQTMVEVTRLDTGKKIVVRINDRGPFVSSRIIDLSKKGAGKLNMIGGGTAPVRVVALARGRPGPTKGAPPVPVAPLPDFNHGRFWVQVGAFGDPANAERALRRLQESMGKARLQPANMPDGRKLIRVQVGPFSELQKADAALADVASNGYAESFVVAGE